MTTSSLITPEFKSLFNNRIDLLLQDNAMTVPCTLIYGDTKFIECPNCLILPNGQSANVYKDGGPIPFNHGTCPYCHQKGKIEQDNNEIVYMGVIYNSKDWIGWDKSSVSPHSPDMFVQTISKRETTYSKIKKAKHAIIDNQVAQYTQTKYERYSEPQPAGLGDTSYITTMWRRI